MMLRESCETVNWPVLSIGMVEGHAVRTPVASRGLAWSACAIGAVYAAVSVYWGLGGTWLLDTVGGSLARLGRDRNAGVLAALWVAVVLKLIAAVAPVLAVYDFRRGARRRAVWIVAWLAAGVLILYGLVLTVVGLLVQTGVVHASRNADWRALDWHAYLWDPWFLVWGLLIAGALLRVRARAAVSRR
jgi:hypothetical protein